MTKKILQIEALPGYSPEIGRALWMMEDTRRRTKELLYSLMQPMIDWRASEQDNTIGALLYHIAVIELDWLYTEVLEQEVPPDLAALFPYDVREDQGRLTVIPGISLEEHVQRLDTVRATLLAAFRSITLEDFRRLRNLATYDVTPEWVLHHLMQHEAEHRGQMGEMRNLAKRTVS